MSGDDKTVVTTDGQRVLGARAAGSSTAGSLVGSWKKLHLRMRLAGTLPNAVLALIVFGLYSYVHGSVTPKGVATAFGLLLIITPVAAALQRGLIRAFQGNLLRVLEGKADADAEALDTLRAQVLSLPWQCAGVAAGLWLVFVPVFQFALSAQHQVTNSKFSILGPGLAFIPVAYAVTLLGLNKACEEHRAALFTGMQTSEIKNFRYMPMQKRVLTCMLTGFYCLVLMAAMVTTGAAQAPNAELYISTLPRMVALFIGVLGVVLGWMCYLALHQDPLEVPALSNPDARNSLSVAYDIQETIGQGGMGVILRAKHRMLGKDVAIKMLDGDAIGDLEAVRRFKQEAQASSRLQHKNIVSVFDFGVLPGGKCYLVMDYLDGKSLSQKIQEEGPVDVEEACEIFVEIAEGLECAHKNKVIHRDLKPANVMVTTTGIVKLVDFGIAKIVGDDAAPNLTRTGQAPGTPNYMSPEQCTGDAIDHRTDVYSFGCLMFEVLTGKVPYAGASPMDTMYMHVNAAVPTVTELKESQALTEIDKIISKAMAKDPKERYSDVKTIAEELRNIQRTTFGAATSESSQETQVATAVSSDRGLNE
jgi:hypothetical protein